MRLRCGACYPEPGWKGRVLASIEPDATRLGSTDRITTIGGRHRVRCHPRRCGAVYVLAADEVARVARAAAGAGREELIAGVDVGRRVIPG